jgi:hypothetical protein
MANNFPNLLPSLNLDLVNGIYVDPRITFTRAGTRTYYGQEVVKAEENLILQSQTFDNASWQPSGLSVTADTTVAPDGTTTADTITYTGVSNYLFQQRPVSSSTAYTFTFYALAGTATEAKYRIFNLTGGADIVAETSYFADINAVTWTRVTIFFTTPVGCTSIYVYPIRNSGTTGTIFLWGAQLEQRSSATAYTATTTQTITNYQRQLKTAAANEWPREFDPVTGECLGRSVWESRTNLSLRSEEFDNAYWTKVGATVSANQVIAPDGTLSMDKLVEDTANSGHSVQGTGVSVTSGIVYTFTIYAKAAERSFIRINGNTTGLVGAAYYNLSTGALGTVAAGTTASIVNVGNGIYRCVFTRTATATSSVSFLVSVTNADNVSSYLGDGYSGIYIWGAQLEAGAFATPYIPTVAAQVTRLADSAVMTGTNFSSWFRQDEGSFFVDSTNSGTFGIPINIHDGTANNQYQVLTGTSGTAFLVTTANVVQANFGTRATPAKTSASYKFNDFMASTNGSVPATDTSGTLPVVSVARIGSRYDNSSHINGYIKRLTYYPQALTSANLTAVTR